VTTQLQFVVVVVVIIIIITNASFKNQLPLISYYLEGSSMCSSFVVDVGKVYKV